MGSRSKAKKSLKGDRVKDKKKPGKKAKPGSETSGEYHLLPIVVRYGQLTTSRTIGTISSSTAKYDEKRKKDGGIANPKLPVTITTVVGCLISEVVECIRSPTLFREIVNASEGVSPSVEALDRRISRALLL